MPWSSHWRWSCRHEGLGSSRTRTRMLRPRSWYNPLSEWLLPKPSLSIPSFFKLGYRSCGNQTTSNPCRNDVLHSQRPNVLDKGQSIAQEFGVDWPMLIAQAVNFVLVAFVIYRFGFKGILSTIQERENKSPTPSNMPKRSSSNLKRRRKAKGNSPGSLARSQEDRNGCSRTSQVVHRRSEGRCSQASRGDHFQGKESMAIEKEQIPK